MVDHFCSLHGRMTLDAVNSSWMSRVLVCVRGEQTMGAHPFSPLEKSLSWFMYG